MKKIFTLIAATLMAVGANAALQTVASYTVAQGAAVDGTEIEGTNCTVQLHAAEIKANVDDATKFGASLNTEAKYIQIDFAEALQAGDVVFFSYFLGSNATADNTEGISVSNLKVDTEGYVELAKLYAQSADKKSIVKGAYIAAGGEKKFIVYKLASTTMFYAVNVVRGYSSTLDLTNPAINTKEAAEANIMDAAYLTIVDTSDGSDGSPVAEWKNDAGQTASFSFTGAPVSVSYKNNSSKTFAKSRTTGFQFNSKDAMMKITCNKGDKITLTPGKYAKDGVGGKYNVTGANVTELTIPENSTDPVTLTSIETVVTLKVVNAGIIAKIVIGESASGIATVKAAKSNDAMFNVAGQKVAEGYKGLVIMNGKKYVQ